MLYAIGAVLLLLVDQAVKYWTVTNLVVNGEAKGFIPYFIELMHIQNDGSAFGMMSGGRWIFLVLTVVLTAVIIYVLKKNVVRGELGRWSLVMIVAGGIGNGIDRLLHGYVVDMFHFSFKIFGYDFPVFNVADIAVTVFGIIFCVWLVFGPEFRDEIKPKAKAKVKNAEEKAETDHDYKKAPQGKKGAYIRQSQEVRPTKAQIDYMAEFMGTSNKPVIEKIEKNEQSQKELIAKVTAQEVLSKPAQKEIIVDDSPTIVVKTMKSTDKVVVEEKAPVIAQKSLPQKPKASASDEFSLESIMSEFE